ncbi:MAG: hypothetical protein AB7T38_15710 [Nitrospirales bacterium]
MTKRKLIVYLLVGVLLLSISGCGGNRYEQRAEVIKEQVASFYGHLELGQADRAIFANQRIEQLAMESEEYLLRRVGQMSQGERTQEWKIIKTAKEAALENWLALARYYTQIREYERAHGAYARLIESYKDSAYQSYVKRAKTGLRDLELMLSP